MERLGDLRGAEQFRQEARDGFNANPLVQDAKAATDRYHELQAEYAKADKAAVKALEDVKAAGLWDEYQKAYRAHRGIAEPIPLTSPLTDEFGCDWIIDKYNYEKIVGRQRAFKYVAR